MRLLSSNFSLLISETCVAAADNVVAVPKKSKNKNVKITTTESSESILSRFLTATKNVSFNIDCIGSTGITTGEPAGNCGRPAITVSLKLNQSIEAPNRINKPQTAAPIIPKKTAY